MARKTRRTQEESSDDDAPEVVSQSTSKADAKRDQKALQDFATEEKARKRARNRERDQKLKERALVTKSGRSKDKVPGKSPSGLVMDGKDEDEDEDEDEIGGDVDDDDGVEARMLRAMRDAAGEMESGEDEDEDEDEDGEFEGFGEMDSDGSDSGLAFGRDDEDDDEMSDWENGSIDPEAASGDEDMDEDDKTTPPKPIVRKSNRKADYLADDLFTAAFASQNSQSSKNKKGVEPKLQTVKKRRRKTTPRVKDTVIGGRTIRTLPRTSDPRSQATARSVPSARARKFLDQSLALKGKQALLKAKKKGWERRPANVGVMKYDGAPHGFARTTR